MVVCANYFAHRLCVWVMLYVGTYELDVIGNFSWMAVTQPSTGATNPSRNWLIPVYQGVYGLRITIWKVWTMSLFFIDVLVQDCSISIADALETLYYCTKPSIYFVLHVLKMAALYKRNGRFLDTLVWYEYDQVQFDKTQHMYNVTIKYWFRGDVFYNVWHPFACGKLRLWGQWKPY